MLRALLLVTALAAPIASAGTLTGPAADVFFLGNFEGVGHMRDFVVNAGIVRPDDGLPVMLQDDNDTYYLAKCRRLDCGTGVDREAVAITDSVKRSVLALGSDGLPVLAYWDEEDDTAKFDRCNDMACTDRSTETLIVADVAEMAITPGPDGFPLIALIDGDRGNSNNLVLIKCNDLSCSTAAEPVVLDQTDFKSRINLALTNSDLPVLSYINLVAPGGVPAIRTITVISCDSADCGGSVQVEPISLGDAFEALNNIFYDKSLSMLIPANRAPVLFAVANPLGENRSKVIAIACNTDTCDDVEDPIILGAEPNYSGGLDAALSADGLPMLIADSSSDAGVEFIQCLTDDCAGDTTVRAFPVEKVGVGTLPRIVPAANGNPLMMTWDNQDSARVIYCRDPECGDFLAY